MAEEDVDRICKEEYEKMKEKMMQLLIDSGANVNAVDSSGVTALMISLSHVCIRLHHTLAINKEDILFVCVEEDFLSTYNVTMLTGLINSDQPINQSVSLSISLSVDQSFDQPM